MVTTNAVELEAAKKSGLAETHPRVYAKQQRFDRLASQGFISPIIRVCWNYLCNFECDHCCAETRMDRTVNPSLVKIGKRDERRKMTHEDLAHFAHEADEYGLYRMVLTGGEPTVWPDLFRVIEILDPQRHLIIMDSNAWMLAERKSLIGDLVAAGVYKFQISLDSFVEHEHDTFRDKKGSYRRVMEVLPKLAATNAKLMVSTCLTRGRANTQEFEDLCKYVTELGAMLYVTYAKPTGTCGQHLDWVITKEDADRIRELETRFNLTTHMTPSYMREKGNVGSAPLGHYDGCITVKGINNLEPDGSIVPCPYMDLAIGNVLEEPLGVILDRGMRNKWLGPQRNDCLIGEDMEFIQIHNATTQRRAEEGNILLPVPYGKGFKDDQLIPV